MKLFASHVLLRWDGHGHAYSPSPRHEILEGFSHISSPTEAMKTNPICSMISFARAIQPATLRNTQTKKCKMRSLFELIFRRSGSGPVGNSGLMFQFPLEKNHLNSNYFSCEIPSIVAWPAAHICRHLHAVTFCCR